MARQRHSRCWGLFSTTSIQGGTGPSRRGRAQSFRQPVYHKTEKNFASRCRGEGGLVTDFPLWHGLPRASVLLLDFHLCTRWAASPPSVRLSCLLTLGLGWKAQRGEGTTRARICCPGGSGRERGPHHESGVRLDSLSTTPASHSPFVQRGNGLKRTLRIQRRTNRGNYY